MKAPQRRPLASLFFVRRRLLPLVAPVLALITGAAVTIAVLGRDASATASTAITAPRDARQSVAFHPSAEHSTQTAAPTRRWPDEIEHLLSSMPRVPDEPGLPPLVETDQRCSRVEDGLAHCVMLECQTAGEQSACFEVVVTARRLRDPPVSMRDGGDEYEDDARGDAVDDGPDAPRLMDARQRIDAPPVRRGVARAASRL
ncbi:MAG: hypothetical protein K0Q76_3204 [Panacagrimonas sp.]|jgi:hypothetical protein|nr:hypothetical protein [Panacagrimonas sp.]MCC2658096.1 hypothetical protein [Panacagrimonas sp.]